MEGFTVDAFEKSSSERAVAAAIRQAMDEKYSKYWNVVVRSCRLAIHGGICMPSFMMKINAYVTDAVYN